MILAEHVIELDALHDLRVLDAEQIEAMPWSDVAGCAGVEQKVLWSLGGFTQALIRYAPGSTTPGEPHLAAHHHVWVHSGDITFAGRRLTAGSYAHVPPGVAHAATDVGPHGCTLLHMHRPHPPREAQRLVGKATVAVHRGGVLPTPRVSTRSGRPSAAAVGSVARLRLRPPTPVAGAEVADGVWWPRSLDLVAELAPLLASMTAEGHAVRRVTYNLDAWQPAPRKPVVNGRVVRLSGYRMLSPRVVHLTSPDATAPFVLLVIPPSADADVAAAALGRGTS